MTILTWMDKYFSKLEKGFLAWGIIFSSLLLFVNVIMRYVFTLPIYWAEELVRYLMVWMIFVGASQVAVWGGHVSVDIVPRIISKRANIVLSLFVNIVAILFCILLAYFSFQQMSRVKAAQQISPAMELPMWIAYLSIPLGTLLMLIRFIQQIYLRIQGKGLEIEEALD